MNVRAWKKITKKNKGVTVTRGVTKFPGMTNAITGASTNDVNKVKTALTEIKKALNAVTASAQTDEYLAGSSGTFRTQFKDGVKRLKAHVDKYVSITDESCTLWVAFDNVFALASSKGQNYVGLRLSSNILKDNTIVLHQQFNNAYLAGGQRKQLTNVGRHQTVLHELAHSLLNARDIEVSGTTYDLGKTNPDNAVTEDSDCKQLAQLTTANVQCGVPLSFMNAENWARAIWQCHPTDSNTAGRVILQV
jgi:hypothetical protein